MKQYHWMQLAVAAVDLFSKAKVSALDINLLTNDTTVTTGDGRVAEHDSISNFSIICLALFLFFTVCTAVTLSCHLINKVGSSGDEEGANRSLPYQPIYLPTIQNNGGNTNWFDKDEANNKPSLCARLSIFSGCAAAASLATAMIGTLEFGL